ncbi:uncharacterized protein LOC142609123 [Castanea sativa]|uniref:uncharacterized protein LOC142609123 n=1 Tax=Castanea sativa TaxID=21020 RepID=UPI003F64AAB7
MEGFRDVVSACGFEDLGFSSLKFTWCNMQEGSNRVYLRLDRAFANSKCFNIFKDAKVYHLVESTSNHCLLRITNSCSLPPTRKHRFHFEAMWAKREAYQEIIEATWNGGNSLITPEGIASNLSRCASKLTAWNKSVIGNIPRKIQEKRKALNNLITQDHVGSHRVAIDEIKKEINDLLDSEEILWHRHNKIHWYKEGDRNTKFFHARASDRRRKNTILGLWNDEGRWCDDKDSILTTALAYFEKIYTTSPSGIQEITNAIPTRVIEEMNPELTKTFTSEEVTRAL